MANFEVVKQYLFELGFKIENEDKENEIVTITDKSIGINNMVIDCEAPILILEQFLFDLKDTNSHVLLRLLQMNRELVHGAFVIDEEGKKVLFRDTLQLENLDLNEIKGSIDSLAIATVEYLDELISFIK
jgi:hypothetical protein